MPRDAQMAGNSLFLCVSMRVLLEEISIWISKLNKEGCSHQCEQASSSLLRIQIEQTSWREGKLSLFLRRHPSSPPVLEHQSSWHMGLQTPGLKPTSPQVLRPLTFRLGLIPSSRLVFWTSDSAWITLLTFLVLQLVDDILCDFSLFKITLTNSHKKSFFICLYIYIPIYKSR